VAAVGVPFAGEVAGGKGDLVVGGADCRAVTDPVGLRSEEVGNGAQAVASGREEFLLGEMLFAAAARVVELNVRVVTDGREVAGVEERARVGAGRSLPSLKPRLV
jgi:hypothetical protein